MDDDDLPPNWIKRQSKKRNVPYYFNTLTKSSVWIHPGKMGVLGNTSSKRNPSIELPSIIVPNVTKELPKRGSDRVSAHGASKSVSSLHTIKASSHDIRRTPAQSRLNKLQSNLSAARAAKGTDNLVEYTKMEAASRKTGSDSRSDRGTTYKIPKISSVKSRIQPSPQLLSDISPSSRETNGHAILARPPKRGVESPKDINHDTPAKRVRLTSDSSTEPSTQSVFSGLVSFAKNVIRTVTSSLSSETDITKSSPPDQSACITSNSHIYSTSPTPSFEPKTSHFETKISKSLQPESSFGYSPTAANDRLSRLRQQIAENQKKHPTASAIASKHEPLPVQDESIDQTMLTDDEDTNSSNLTNDSDDESMDWDECLEENVANTSTTSKSGICIVLDTNVLIDNLPLIRSLVDASFFYNGRQPNLMVPYVVLQELDYQKQRKVVPVSTKAQCAIKFIHERLKNKDQRFQGQTSKSNSQVPARIHIATNDDRILNCALQCQDHSGEVALLSNDINLRNLALLNELRALSAAEMQLWLAEQQSANTTR